MHNPRPPPPGLACSYFFSPRFTDDCHVSQCHGQTVRPAVARETKSISKSLPNQLGSYNFLVKQEKMASNNLASQLGIFFNLAYFLFQRLNMPSCHLIAIAISSWGSVPSGHKNCLWAFFCFGKLKIANSWTWALFLLGILFWELAKHLICEVKDSKLLEML